jgi:hypothetical protein
MSLSPGSRYKIYPNGSSTKPGFETCIRSREIIRARMATLASLHAKMHSFAISSKHPHDATLPRSVQRYSYHEHFSIVMQCNRNTALTDPEPVENFITSLLVMYR